MTTQIFDNVTRQARLLGEKNDCSVRAVAIACGYEEDYEGVHYVFQLYGRRPRRVTAPFITRMVVKALRCVMIDVTNGFSGRTVRTIGRELRHRKGNYIILVAGHVLAATDGKIHDWTRNRLHRVRQVWRVVELGKELIEANR